MTCADEDDLSFKETKKQSVLSPVLENPNMVMQARALVFSLLLISVVLVVPFCTWHHRISTFEVLSKSVHGHARPCLNCHTKMGTLRQAL